MTREELDQALRELLTDIDIDVSNGHIYYEPDQNIKIQIPAFIYSFTGINNASADNDKLYQCIPEYQLRWLHEDSSIDMVLKVIRRFRCAAYTNRTQNNNVTVDSFRLNV